MRASSVGPRGYGVGFALHLKAARGRDGFIPPARPLHVRALRLRIGNNLGFINGWIGPENIYAKFARIDA